MPKIFIALPTHRALMDVSCAISLAGLTHHLGVTRNEVWVNNIDSADIAYSRNLAAAGMLRDPSFTHLLFVDSDMAFSPRLVVQMLEAKVDFIGAVYPRRFGGTKGLAAVAQAGKRGLDENAAIAEAAGFIPHDALQYNYVNGVAEVAHIGMGLCLVARQVFEKLIASGQVPAPEVMNDAPHGFFQQIVRDGRYYGEDASFCMRWREICGGKVHAVISKDIAHMARIEVRATPPARS